MRVNDINLMLAQVCSEASKLLHRVEIIETGQRIFGNLVEAET